MGSPNQLARAGRPCHIWPPFIRPLTLTLSPGYRGEGKKAGAREIEGDRAYAHGLQSVGLVRQKVGRRGTRGHGRWLGVARFLAVC